MGQETPPKSDAGAFGHRPEAPASLAVAPFATSGTTRCTLVPVAITVHTVAEELGVDAADVRVVAGWIAEQTDVDDVLDDELDQAVRAILDPEGERTAREQACPGCGRAPGPYLVLVGWRPCLCGGHRTTYCRADNGGCGTTRFDPEIDPDRGCAEPGFGFGGPAT